MNAKNDIQMTKLEEKFPGSGETSNFEFVQKMEGVKTYIYEVITGEFSHFEVFMKRATPVCVDFKNRVYSLTEFKEVYPKSKNFGDWAWTYTDYEEALKKFNSIENES